MAIAADTRPNLITSMIRPTNAHTISHKTLLKHFKTLRHVSILSDRHQGALLLAFIVSFIYIFIIFFCVCTSVRTTATE